MIHPPGGIVVCYRELAGGCGEDQPFYAIRSRGLHGEETLPETVEEMAADYVAALKTVAPVGPYQIGGWSLGGIVAYEVARQLLAAGDSVERLILLDTSIPKGASDLVAGDENPNAGLEYGLELTLEELAQLEPDEVLPFLWQHAKNLGVLDDDTPVEVVDRALQDLQHLFHHHVDVIGQYTIEPLPAAVPVLLVRPHDVPMDVITSEDRGWSAIVSDLRVEFVAGHHHSMVQPPGVDEIASLLS
jgi:thioesterase domain-containing protein